MDAPFHDDASMHTWLRGLALRELDCVVEYRGRKGSGKSGAMLWDQFVIDPERTPEEAYRSLCYSPKQFAGVYTAVREDRKTERKRPKFIWGDDADQLFDRRAHASQRNRAMLGLVRKARDQLRSIQQLGTQDDFLEAPLLHGGLFIRIIFETPFEGKVYWPIHNKMLEGDPKWEYVCTIVYPDPYEVYPVTWRGYQSERRKLTETGTEELLDVIDPKPVAASNEETLKAALIAERDRDVTASIAQIVRNMKAKGVEVSYGYARQVLATTPRVKLNTVSGGSQPALPAAAPQDHLSSPSASSTTG